MFSTNIKSYFEYIFVICVHYSTVTFMLCLVVMEMESTITDATCRHVEKYRTSAGCGTFKWKSYNIYN